MRLLAGICALAALTTPSALTEDATPSYSDPFIGKWQIAFPDEPGVIVNVPDATCEAPAVISASDTSENPNAVDISTPGGSWGEWHVRSFDGRFPWWQFDPEKNDYTDITFVADWTSEDTFLLAGKDSSGWRTDWTTAKEWTRCPTKTD